MNNNNNKKSDIEFVVLNWTNIEIVRNLEAERLTSTCHSKENAILTLQALNQYANRMH